MGGFSLDKHIPVATLIAFAIQTIVLVWIGATWKAEIDGRVTALERVDASRNNHETRIIILEQAIPYIKESLTRIEREVIQNPDRNNR